MTRSLFTAIFTVAIFSFAPFIAQAQTSTVTHVSEDHVITSTGAVTTTRNVTTLDTTTPQSSEFIMYDDIKEPLQADNELPVMHTDTGATYNVKERKVLHYYNPDGSERVVVDEVDQHMHHAQ